LADLGIDHRLHHRHLGLAGCQWKVSMKITQHIDWALWPYLRSGMACTALMVVYFVAIGAIALLVHPLWLMVACDAVALTIAILSTGSRHRYVLWRDSLVRSSKRGRISR
jgi:hypothetical protein